MTASIQMTSHQPSPGLARRVLRSLRSEPSLSDILAPQRPFGVSAPALVLVRWITVVVGMVLVGRVASWSDAALGLPVLGVAVVRSVQWRHPGPRWLQAVAPGLIAEFALAIGVALGTGGQHSPWLIAVVLQAACLGALVPSRWAGSVAAAGLIAVLAAGSLLRVQILDDGLVVSIALLAIVFLTVAYATWVLARTERHRALLAEANDRLATTNALLIGLDHASPRAGEAFDPRRCARSIASTARLVLDPTSLVVLATTTLPGRWQVLHAEGCKPPDVLDAPDVRGLFGGDAVLAIDLRIHDRVVGQLLFAHHEPGHWDRVDSSAIAQLGERGALMLDNARRFNALWVVGVTEERTRMAHDLHDHLGQSMAALGLELDILARRTAELETRETVAELRGRVTAMVADLRGTMRDLRCDVSDTKGLGPVLERLVHDLSSRTNATIEVDAEVQGRLSLAHEHQLLLVAREAIETAVTDAGARNIHVQWLCDGESGTLEVKHDGEIADLADMGALSTAAHLDALRGIEDRCHAIGAHLSTDVAGSICCEVAG